MRKVKLAVIIVFLLIVLLGVGLYLAGSHSPKPGGVRIETKPQSSVFINGSMVGETPYQGSFTAGKVLLRLVPQVSDENLIPFETSLTLSPGMETVIGREFRANEADSSGYIISFEKTGKKTAGLYALTDPENAQVLIDGVSRGFSPYETNAIAPAMHVITFKSPGRGDFSLTVKTLAGHRLVFFAKLGGESVENPVTELSAREVKTVKILNTPTGYLRVRSEPGSGGEEIAQAKPGESFPYLDTDVVTGWYKIQYEASKSGMPSGIVGWVSADYASVSSILK